MNNSSVYLDYNATTPIDGDLRDQLDSWLDQWGNPSSIHQFGRGPKQMLRESRRSLAQWLECHPLEIIFTSGGSEANNLAIQGLLAALKTDNIQRNEILVSSIEHPSVRNTVAAMANRGYKVIAIPSDRSGQLDLEFYHRQLSEKTALVSVMLANNEVGVISPIKKMVTMAKEVGAYFHSDCVQAIGKVEFSLADLGVDFASFSSHKIYALRGAGFLFAKKGTPLEPILFGGAQERKRRAGTENLLAIASQSFMVDKLQSKPQFDELKSLRDFMESEISSKISGVEILAQDQERLPNTSMIVVSGVDGEIMMMNLDIKGFAVSTGAACSSGNPEPNPVLLAMGLSRQEAQSSLRISLGRMISKAEVSAFVEALVEVVDHLRNIQANDGMAYGN